MDSRLRTRSWLQGPDRGLPAVLGLTVKGQMGLGRQQSITILQVRFAAGVHLLRSSDPAAPTVGWAGGYQSAEGHKRYVIYRNLRGE